jgi:hypothetical protein
MFRRLTRCTKTKNVVYRTCKVNIKIRNHWYRNIVTNVLNNFTSSITLKRDSHNLIKPKLRDLTSDEKLKLHNYDNIIAFTLDKLNKHNETNNLNTEEFIYNLKRLNYYIDLSISILINIKNSEELMEDLIGTKIVSIKILRIIS